MDWYKPSPVREGPEIWLASLALAPPAMIMLLQGSLVTSTVAAASPRLIPLRSESKGLAGSSLSALKDLNPDNTNSVTRSAPHTITLRYFLFSIKRFAIIIASSPDMQALETI